jgi:heme A synthase
MKEWGPRISTLWEREGIGPQSAPTTSRRRIVLLFGVLALVAVAAVGGWVAGNWIESPAEVAARTAPPTASPILVPVEAERPASACRSRSRSLHRS